MQRGEALIYGGHISHGDLIGQPDLLRREGTAYAAGDTKSSDEATDSDDGKPKKHYLRCDERRRPVRSFKQAQTATASYY
jgi:hypothetical protein